MLNLRNDKILVFGGGSIGKAVAERLVNVGATVMITGRTERKLKETANAINSDNLYYKVFDITNIRYGHNGIIINGIAPGATFTPMISDYAHDINQKYERHAIERFIRPDEIAELAFYLMSNYGEIICGHTVIADGGDNAATL